MPPAQLHPPPFRTPFLDKDGQIAETWRRYFLSGQVFTNQILQTLAATTTKPGLIWGDEPEWPEAWIQPVQTVPPPTAPLALPGLMWGDDPEWPDLGLPPMQPALSAPVAAFPASPSLVWTDEPEWPEAWVPLTPPAIPGPPGPQGFPGRDGDDALDDASWLINTGGVVRSGQVGLPSPVVVVSGRTVAATGAVASIATYTVGAADGSFLVSMNILITAFTAGTVSGVVNYTDESATARSLTMNFSAITGVLSTTAGAAGAFEGVPLHIRAKAATVITVTTTVSIFTGTYNVESFIIQIG